MDPLARNLRNLAAVNESLGFDVGFEVAAGTVIHKSHDRDALFEVYAPM
jgi:hypothetical protein